MDDRPFSLQLQSARRQGPQSISEFIRRVNAEPGGFRGLNAADLRRQVDAQANGGQADPNDQDVDMTADASDSGVDEADAQDIAAAREGLLRAIFQTHQTSMFALDFVSLLLSKENPAQAVTTFSPGLRDMVGVGTLGATMLDAPTTLARSRIPDNRMVAIGKRLMDLNKAADAALAASKRLNKEIDFETQYWSEVLGVGEAGWQTFRLPHEPQTLAVQFGFSNTSPAFKNSGIASLRRAKDGSVNLEHGDMSGGSKRLQVRIVENGKVVGASTLPKPLPSDAPLQDRVKEARDTVFSRELWHEINREARTELDHVVRISASAVAYDLDATRSVSLHLVTPGSEDSVAADQPGILDDIADEVCALISLLLMNAHRENAVRRSEPTTAKSALPPYSLLRPMIAYTTYHGTIQQCARSLETVASVLRSAGLPSAVVMKEPVLPTTLPGARTAPSSAMANLFIHPPPVEFDLTITPTSRLRVLLKPTARLPGAAYSVTFLPPLESTTPHPIPHISYVPPGAANPLVALCPPAADGYATLDDLLAYLCGAVPIAVTAAFADLARTFPLAGPPAQMATMPLPNAGSKDGEPDQDADGNGAGNPWAVAADLRSLVDRDTGGEYGARFDLVRDAAAGTLELVLTGDYLGGEEGGGAKEEHDSGDEDEDEDEEMADGAGGNHGPKGADGQRKKKVHRVWKWPGEQDADVVMAVSYILGHGPGSV
ncbi:hypothetical protein VTJ83DRAFT_3905 [Remersonia thermophila]|uniref:Mediator of RNA polymerase II transcription subunit 17 n=1 Tax=Remersonia thermophila TaxID=72144 RepID=A0ABR4DG86_9PEZI